MLRRWCCRRRRLARVLARGDALTTPGAWSRPARLASERSQHLSTLWWSRRFRRDARIWRTVRKRFAMWPPFHLALDDQAQVGLCTRPTERKWSRRAAGQRTARSGSRPRAGRCPAGGAGVASGRRACRATEGAPISSWSAPSSGPAGSPGGRRGALAEPSSGSFEHLLPASSRSLARAVEVGRAHQLAALWRPF